MMPTKPRITKFIWHDLLMALDWENLQRAFDITRQDGDAGIFHQPKGPGTPGVMAAINAEQIRGFKLRPYSESGLIEVVLEVAYPPGEESLGISEQITEAERWVQDANELLLQVRNQKYRKF